MERPMSSAEIADNKWELQASRPQMATASGIMQILLMVGFVGVFGYLITFSIVGAVTPKNEDAGLANKYKNMKAAAPEEEKAE
jgi:hypothetical protein